MTSGFKSQLNFLICRVQHADACAKQTAPMHAEAIGKWKANHHIPVFASYKLIQPYKLGKQKTLPNRLAAQDQASVLSGDAEAHRCTHEYL